jgi:hypothetical protein
MAATCFFVSDFLVFVLICSVPWMFCIDWPKFEDLLNAGKMIHLLRRSFLAAAGWFVRVFFRRCGFIARRFWFSF